MKIDAREMRQLAAIQAPRMDLYGGIHKALRALMADTLLALGRMDSSDDLDTARTTLRVVELLEFCRSHLRHENEFVHAAIEARAPGASEAVGREHEEHEQHLDALAGKVDSVRAVPAGQRAAAALDLYRSLALFIAANFDHMHVEETAHNAALWAHYTDAELVEIHNAILASIPPGEMMFTIRWLIPFMNPAERAAVLGNIRANAPAPAFLAIVDTVRPHLSAGEWAKLSRSVDLDAASATP